MYLFDQIVEYEKFNDLNRDEFLEARHELLIAYSDEKWNRLIGLLEKALVVNKLRLFLMDLIDLIVIYNDFCGLRFSIFVGNL